MNNPDNNTTHTNQPAARRFTLNKSEKLRHNSLLVNLFKSGKSLYEWPLRVMVYAMDEEELKKRFRTTIPDKTGPLQMMVSVPKKRRRHAVDRVLVRRRIREAYRLNRHELRDVVMQHPQIRTVQMAFIYLADKNVDYHLIEKKMVSLLRKIKDSAIENTKEVKPEV